MDPVMVVSIAMFATVIGLILFISWRSRGGRRASIDGAADGGNFADGGWFDGHSHSSGHGGSGGDAGGSDGGGGDGGGGGH